MFNRFLRRLPNEVHKATWYPFDEKTQKHLTTGETFYYAFNGEELDSQIVVMSSLYTNSTQALILNTSSDLQFKVGDKIEVRGVSKLITDVGTKFLDNDYQLSIDFQPNIEPFYRILVLS
jgi:NifB/MoaA-like Fe-S oxidoreductase